MPVTDFIALPRDQYAHLGAQAEWWWHTGTLKCGDRVFGFEINATGHSQAQDELPPFSFSQIMVTDVQAQAHYQKTTLFAYDPSWAQSNPDTTWYASLGVGGTDGFIDMMQAGSGDPMNMVVEAIFQDGQTACALNLVMTHQGPPLLVWGDGRKLVNPDAPDPLNRYNYYYSLTQMRASGRLRIGGESFDVEGVTWMDHEYGAFAMSTRWILQDMQLDNGLRISNVVETTPPVLNQPMASYVSILWPDGVSTLVNAITTPLAPTWVGSTGITYCLTMRIEIPEHNALLTVSSLMPGQEFSEPAVVYEGVAWAEGEFSGQAVSGTAWLEQRI